MTRMTVLSQLKLDVIAIILSGTKASLKGTVTLFLACLLSWKNAWPTVFYTHSFSKHLSSTYYALLTVIDTEATAGKTKTYNLVLALMEFISQWREADRRQPNEQMR